LIAFTGEPTRSSQNALERFFERTFSGTGLCLVESTGGVVP